ncbi:Glucose-6-phosphate isomerase [Collichthys lucidus]|uniref:Glucose-6-phosphate isomerase n=1 Tax=Collichthys lucidus TaxID=240159 RepID=A0A4U5UFR5_COLLU|nr:Glucose-6-phosphate isomerase [Collichthys lucidus]
MALTNDPTYKKLEQWYKASAGSLNMRAMFESDPDRFSRFSDKVTGPAAPLLRPSPSPGPVRRHRVTGVPSLS